MDWLLRLQSPPLSLYHPLTRQASQPGGGRADLIFPRPLSEGILTTPRPRLVSTSREVSSVRKGDNNKTNPPKTQGSPMTGFTGDQVLRLAVPPVTPEPQGPGHRREMLSPAWSFRN